MPVLRKPPVSAELGGWTASGASGSQTLGWVKSSGAFPKSLAAVSVGRPKPKAQSKES